MLLVLTKVVVSGCEEVSKLDGIASLSLLVRRKSSSWWHPQNFARETSIPPSDFIFSVARRLAYASWESCNLPTLPHFV